MFNQEPPLKLRLSLGLVRLVGGIDRQSLAHAAVHQVLQSSARHIHLAGPERLWLESGDRGPTNHFNKGLCFGMIQNVLRIAHSTVAGTLKWMFLVRVFFLLLRDWVVVLSSISFSAQKNPTTSSAHDIGSDGWSNTGAKYALTPPVLYCHRDITHLYILYLQSMHVKSVCVQPIINQTIFPVAIMAHPSRFFWFQ